MILIRRIIFLCIAAVMLCTACGVKDKETAGNDVEGGELVVIDDVTDINLGIYGIDTLNPLETKSESVRNIMNLVYESLFTCDEKGGSVPQLAESYAVSEDGLSVTVNLKKNVKWHNGTVFTADDVVYTLSKLRTSDGLYKKTAKKIRSFTATDKYQVQINFSEPQPDFTPCLIFPVISSKTPYKNDISFEPIGTGSYKYASGSGTELLLEPNTDWYGETVSKKKIRVKILKDSAAAADAFNVGELDVITSEELDITASAPKNNSQTKTVLSNNMVFLGFNAARLSENVRRAAVLAVDKEKLVQNEVYGHGVTADISIKPTAWAYSEYKTGLGTEDIAALLMQDGYRPEGGAYYSDGNPLVVKILVNEENTIRVNAAEALCAMLNSAGFTAETERVTYSEYADKINADDFDMFIGETETAENMVPYAMLSSDDNYFNYDRSELTAGINALYGVTDREEYKRAVEQFVHLFYLDPPYLPLYYKTESVIYGSYVSGIEEPTVFNPYKNAEKWYFYNKTGKESNTDGE